MSAQFDNSFEPQPEPARARKRVLVIEDDLCLETILCRILKAVSPEIEIDWLTSAEEALLRIEPTRGIAEGGYDLVLADIFLDGHTTGIDFWETCQALRPDLPVLLMSGMPIDEFFRTIGRESVSPPYLPKPFSVGECGQIIESMLKYGRLRRPGSAVA
jgi:DNA-binding response OmpR family regulator